MPSSACPKDVEPFRFLQDDELVSCAQSQVDELRGKGCDLVVCVGHIGNNTNGELNNSRALLQHVKGIDLFIDGHDHQEVEEEVAGTLLVETGCCLHNIGVVAIDEGAPKNELVAYGSFDKVDKSVQAVIDQENERVQSQLNVVLGSTPFLLDGNRVPGVRTQEANLGDFIADAYKWTAEAQSPVMFSFDYEAISSYLITPCNHTVPSAYVEPQGRITILGA